MDVVVTVQVCGDDPYTKEAFKLGLPFGKNLLRSRVAYRFRVGREFSALPDQRWNALGGEHGSATGQLEVRADAS